MRVGQYLTVATTADATATTTTSPLSHIIIIINHAFVNQLNGFTQLRAIRALHARGNVVPKENSI
jgi:hypothetical protein